MNFYNNLVLIGFRGAGKTTFGQAMAAQKKLPFVDLDKAIEFALGRDIKDFVEEHGWQVFREMEQRVTHDFCRNFTGVIATGGGTIENSKNFQNLKKRGQFVWVNPSFMQVKKYLLQDTTRPRINPDIPHAQEIDQMWAQRKDIYNASADFTAEPDLNGDPAVEAEKIWATVNEKVIPPAPESKKVLVLSSSGGTTLDHLLQLQKSGRLPNIEWAGLITDTPKCGATSIAKKGGIKKIETLEPQDDWSREDYDRSLINLVRQIQPDIILLAGWMRILSPVYCEQFGPISYNAHPSLLPKYAGMKDREIHQKVLEEEDPYTGATIHRVIAEVDQGDNVVQRKLAVEEFDDAESLRTKVQRQEALGFCELLEKL